MAGAIRDPAAPGTASGDQVMCQQPDIPVLQPAPGIHTSYGDGYGDGDGDGW